MYASTPSLALVIDDPRRLAPATNPNPADRSAAWAEWLESAQPALLRFMRAANGTAESDEDLLQDALVIAYLGVERGAYQPRPGVPFTAYVKGICRNKIREAARRSCRTTSLDDLPELNLAAPLAHRFPEARLVQREQADAFQVALEQLSEPRRQVITRTLSGQTTGQIAAEMRISEELVRQHKCRSVRYLRKTVPDFTAPVASLAV